MTYDPDEENRPHPPIRSRFQRDLIRERLTHDHYGTMVYGTGTCHCTGCGLVWRLRENLDPRNIRGSIWELDVIDSE